MTTVEIHLKLRAHQLAAYCNRTRFTVRVFHRRAGKTFLSIGELLTDALQPSRKDWRGFYIAPTFTQAKAIAFDYLKRFTTGIPGTEVNESELRVDLPNGSRIQLLGAERYDSLRGRYADAVVLDETAQIPSAAWDAVLSPMLADRKGRATFIGTPQGRMNLFYALWEYAGTGDPEWSRLLLTHEDTNILDQTEIARLKRSLRPEVFAQELDCSWNAALTGAYYAKEMAALEAANRVLPLTYDKTLPVTAAVDLGWSDAMAVTFAQSVAGEHRILSGRAWQYTSIPDMVRDWRDLPFPIDQVVLPHDAKVRELGTGASRQEVFHNLGCTTTIAPSQTVHEGISAVRDLLPNCWFDRDGTKTLREALNTYRSEFDDVRQVHRVTPIHDWSSHWADSFRYYALGRPGSMNWGPRPRSNMGIYA